MTHPFVTRTAEEFIEKVAALLSSDDRQIFLSTLHRYKYKEIDKRAAYDCVNTMLQRYGSEYAHSFTFICELGSLQETHENLTLKAE